MDNILIVGLIMFCAFVLQTIFAYIQIRNFNKIYQNIRSRGKVAIGRKSGKVRAGTIVFFGINDDGQIFDAYLMQGVTVLSKFKQIDQYVGQNLHFIDKHHPLVQKENKLTQFAMENARDLFVLVDAGKYHEPETTGQVDRMMDMMNVYKSKLVSKLNGRI